MGFESDWTQPMKVYITAYEFLVSILDFLVKIRELLPSLEPILSPLIELICR
jgi:hypothetical protein